MTKIVAVNNLQDDIKGVDLFTFVSLDYDPLFFMIEVPEMKQKVLNDVLHNKNIYYHTETLLDMMTGEHFNEISDYLEYKGYGNINDFLGSVVDPANILTVYLGGILSFEDGSDITLDGSLNLFADSNIIYGECDSGDSSASDFIHTFGEELHFYDNARDYMIIKALNKE